MSYIIHFLSLILKPDIFCILMLCLYLPQIYLFDSIFFLLSVSKTRLPTVIEIFPLVPLTKQYLLRSHSCFCKKKDHPAVSTILPALVCQRPHQMSDDPERCYATIFSILTYYLSLTYCYGSMRIFSKCHYVGFGLCTPSFKLQFLGSVCVLGRGED